MRINLTLFGLIIVIGLAGQEFKRVDFQFDFGGNLSIPYKRTIEIRTDIDGHPETHYKPGLGYFFELMTIYNFSNKLSIKTVLNYNQGKIKITDKIGLFESKGYISTSYLHIPLMIKYRFSNFLPVSLSFGPYLNILISAIEKGTTTIDTAGFITIGDVSPPIIEPVKDYNNDIKKNYSEYDFGLSAQVDYAFIMSNKFSSLIFTRFNYGLKDVITNEIYMNNSAQVWKNISLMIGVGFKL